MTTSIADPPRVRDPLTERILQIISRKGLYQRGVAEMAGMSANTFYTRVKSGRWSHDELHDIATALNEYVGVLLDVTETL